MVEIEPILRISAEYSHYHLQQYTWVSYSADGGTSFCIQSSATSQALLRMFSHCRRRHKQPLSPSPFWLSSSGYTLSLPDIKQIRLKTF